MLKSFFALVSLLVSLVVAINSFGENVRSRSILDMAQMEKVRQSITSPDSKYHMNYENLLKQADKSLLVKPLSVLDKEMVPPSGDKHDYMSIGTYWWPDKSKPDGLPWIRKDGKTNPQLLGFATDSGAYNVLKKNTFPTALAYFYSRNPKYAQKAADFLKTWFTSPETGLNPNLKYGQGTPGISEGRLYGIIDYSLNMQYFLNSIDLIRGSEFWTAEDERRMDEWLKKYLHWVTTSKLGIGAKSAENNHGTWWYAHVALIRYYLGQKTLALNTVAEAFKTKFSHQFAKDGSQPHELKRTLSYNYSRMNLMGWIQLCRIAELCGEPKYWYYQAPNGATLNAGIIFILPAAYGKWAYKNIKTIDPALALEILNDAYNVYQDSKILDAINAISPKGQEASVYNLTHPQATK